MFSSKTLLLKSKSMLVLSLATFTVSNTFKPYIFLSILLDIPCRYIYIEVIQACHVLCACCGQMQTVAVSQKAFANADSGGK